MANTREVEKLKVDQKWLRETLSRIRVTMEDMGKSMVAINQRDERRELDIRNLNRKVDDIAKSISDVPCFNKKLNANGGK